MIVHRYIGSLHDFNNCEECKRPTIMNASYAKNMYAVICPSYESGWKTREMSIAEEMTRRYSSRESAYIMSRSQARRFIESIKPMQPVFYNLDEAEFDK